MIGCSIPSKRYSARCRSMAVFATVTEIDHGWDAAMEEVRQMNTAGGYFAKVGVLSDDKIGGMHKTDPETGKAEDLTVAEIAAIQEFGTEDGHIPERSFLRSTFDKLRPRLQDEAEKLIVRVIFRTALGTGGIDAKKALDIMGSLLASETKKAITTGPQIPPPNAPSTFWRKVNKGMKAKPIRRVKKEFGLEEAMSASASGVRTLIETMTLVRAICWAVVMGGKEDTPRHP